jgi:hypothetical protein
MKYQVPKFLNQLPNELKDIEKKNTKKREPFSQPS